jgi:Flp pilus assembly pilin Flp
MRRFVRQTRGQTTVEYAIVFLWGVLVVMASFEALEAAILDYYYDVTSLLCLPIP